VSVTVVGRFEAGTHSLSDDELSRLVDTFTAAGVEFINGDEPGVKLKKLT
jgi:hypothetical protein